MCQSYSLTVWYTVATYPPTSRKHIPRAREQYQHGGLFRGRGSRGEGEVRALGILIRNVWFLCFNFWLGVELVWHVGVGVVWCGVVRGVRDVLLQCN